MGKPREGISKASPPLSADSTVSGLGWQGGPGRKSLCRVFSSAPGHPQYPQLRHGRDSSTWAVPRRKTAAKHFCSRSIFSAPCPGQLGEDSSDGFRPLHPPPHSRQPSGLLLDELSFLLMHVTPIVGTQDRLCTVRPHNQHGSKPALPWAPAPAVQGACPSEHPGRPWAPGGPPARRHLRQVTAERLLLASSQARAWHRKASSG